MTREIEHTANNITDSVYRQILEQIIAGRYRPGDRIPTENELKETFNVSRNTIRAALNRLNTLEFWKPGAATEPMYASPAWACTSTRLFPPC